MRAIKVKDKSSIADGQIKFMRRNKQCTWRDYRSSDPYGDRHKRIVTV